MSLQPHPGRFRPQSGTACQLIAAINARIWHGLPDIADDEFARLCKLVRCEYGSALQVHLAYPSLGLLHEDYPGEDIPGTDWLIAHLPVAITYYDRVFGFHSALVVSCDRTHVRLVNAADSLCEWAAIRFPPFHYQRVFRYLTVENQKEDRREPVQSANDQGQAEKPWVVSG